MPSADETPSAFTDALEIFYAPSEVFQRRKLEPAFGLPLIILVLGIGILFFASRGAMDPIFDAEFKRGFATAMKQNPQLTSEMEAQAQVRIALMGNVTLDLVTPFLRVEAARLNAKGARVNASGLRFGLTAR